MKLKSLSMKQHEQIAISIISMILYCLIPSSLADTNLTMYVNSDSAVNGDGSLNNPFSDLFYAMNTITTTLPKNTFNPNQHQSINLNDGNVISIYLNPDAKAIYNMFDPAKSPNTYLSNTAQSIIILAYSTAAETITNRPVIRLQDFFQVQNTSFSIQGCKVLFAITDASKILQKTNQLQCQIDLISSIPHFYQVTFQIVDETTGGYIPTYKSFIQNEQLREAAKEKDERKYKNDKKQLSLKDVYISRSFVCTHQQLTNINSAANPKNRLLQSNERLKSSNSSNNKNYSFIYNNIILEDINQLVENYGQIQQADKNINQVERGIKESKRSINDSKRDKRILQSALTCAFSEIEIVDSAIKIESQDYLSIWEGSLINLSFAKNDVFGQDTCELRDIAVKNVNLCSDMVGTIISINYEGQQDVDFKKNVVNNLSIDNSHLLMVDILVLNLLESEMKKCSFDGFTLSNSFLQSSVGTDQSAFIKISISKTVTAVQRELSLSNHKIVNNTFTNARYFSVEPQFNAEAVDTTIKNLLLDSNTITNTNCKETQMFSNATQISIFNSTIQHNVFTQIVVFDSKFNQVVAEIQLLNNLVYNNTFVNSLFYSAELMDMSNIVINDNNFFHNFQLINSQISQAEQTIIQSTMFRLQGKASELEFNNNYIKVGKPSDDTQGNCTCYTEQFTFFMQVDSISLVSIRDLTFEDPCNSRAYNLRQIEPNAIWSQEYKYQNPSEYRSVSSSEKRGGFLELKGFVLFEINDSIFRNVLTSSPLISLNDEYFVSSSTKITTFKNITLESNTLLVISESSLLLFNYQDSHSVTFLKNTFKDNILILAMDRVIGYTAPCISFKGYNSIFNMMENSFLSTAIRFEVYSQPMGGNALIAAVNITISNSIFKDSCQNIIDSSIEFSPFDIQCFKNQTDIDENFLKFSDGGALNLFGTNSIVIQNSTFSNNEAKRGGAIFLSGQVQNISIMSNNFTRNNAIEGGVIYSEQVKVMHKVYFSHIIFASNSALKYGVVIDSFLFFKHFEMEFCIFANNFIRQSGSDSTYMVKLEKLGDCRVKISNIFFFGSNQLKFSGDYIQIFHSNQKESRSNKDVIQNQDDLKTIEFQHCYFFIAGQQTAANNKYFPQAITLMSRKNDYNPVKTPVFLNNIVFAGENRISSFKRFFPTQAENLYILQFFKNETETTSEIKYSSQALYTNNADLTVNNTNVINILHSNGCITIKNSYLHISNSMFEMNYKANRYYNASQLVITSQQPEKHNSLIEQVIFRGFVAKQGDLQYDSQMVSLNNIQNVEIKDCQFINASADYGSAIQIQEKVQNISISNSFFLNNWSRYNGGSISVESDCASLTIQQSNFTNSKSYYGLGGAVAINKMNNNFTITHNIFLQNVAVFGNSVAILSFDHDSLKSVLAHNYYEQDLSIYSDIIEKFAKYTLQNQVMLNENNIIYSDWQQIIPSSEISLNFTLYYRSYSYEWDTKQTTLANTSSSSLAQQLQQQQQKQQIRSLNELSIGQFTEQREKHQAMRQASDREQQSQKEKNVVDIQSQLSYISQVDYTLSSVGQDAVFSPIKPNIEASFISSYNMEKDILTVVNNQLVVSDDRGYLQTVSVGVNNNVTYLNYYSIIKQLQTYGLVDSNKNATYDLLYSDSQSLSSIVPNYPFFNKTTYQPYVMGIGLSECNSGFSFDSSNRRCDYCQQGVYTLDPQGYKPCLACEQNSVCLGGYKIEVNEGYWRDSLYNSDIQYCNKNPYNCLQTQNPFIPYSCEQGYTGPLCQACDNQNNYFTNGDGRCYTCNNGWVTILIFISKKFIFFLYECFYIYTTAFANTLFATSGHECHALNVRRLNKVYVRIIQTYFQIMSLIISQYSMVGEQFFQIFNDFFSLIGFPVDSVNYNYECWLYESMGPDNDYYAYYASLISLSEPLFKILIIFIIWLIKRALKIEAIKNRYFIISITSIILIEQLGVIKILLGSFKCISIDSGGSYMERNPNVSCQSSTYTTFTSFIYIPMMILWAGGFTLLLFFYICRNKKNLEQKQMKLFFGFYYMCFRQKYFYWDIIIYLMKLLLLMLNYFVLNSDKLRFSCTTLILLAYCLAIKIYKPYTLDRQNKCDQILFYNLIFTMFLCYNIDNTNSNSINTLFLVFLSLSNLLFIGYISWRMFYIVRYFFKKFKTGANNNQTNQKKSFKNSVQDKNEESEDEEQKNYLMQAEMEYNHLELAVKDNQEEVIIKLEDENDDNVPISQNNILIPHRKLETEQIRQRYEYHQYLKSIVDHNHQQPVNLDYIGGGVYTDGENEDSLIQNATPASSNNQQAKQSFAFQKRSRLNQYESVIAPSANKPAFKSFNQPIGRHEFGKNKKSVLKSQIEHPKSNSNNNLHSVIINPNSNNNLYHKESIGGGSGTAANQHRHNDFQNSLVSASSHHYTNKANLKKSIISHLKKSFVRRKQAGMESMINNNGKNNFNFSQLNNDDEDHEDYYDNDHSSFHNYNNRNDNRWSNKNQFVEDEVRQRNAVLNKSQLFNENENNAISIENHNSLYANNNDTNILGSIKVNTLNNPFSSNRKNTGSRFNNFTTRAPSTTVNNQGNQALYTTQNEIDAQLEAKRSNSLSEIQQGIANNHNKYDTDSFYIEDKINNEEEDNTSSDQEDANQIKK